MQTTGLSKNLAGVIMRLSNAVVNTNGRSYFVQSVGDRPSRLAIEVDVEKRDVEIGLRRRAQSVSHASIRTDDAHSLFFQRLPHVKRDKSCILHEENTQACNWDALPLWMAIATSFRRISARRTNDLRGGHRQAAFDPSRRETQLDFALEIERDGPFEQHSAKTRAGRRSNGRPPCFRPGQNKPVGAVFLGLVVSRPALDRLEPKGSHISRHWSSARGSQD